VSLSPRHLSHHSTVMVMNETRPGALDPDNSSTYTDTTPPGSMADNLDWSSSSVPYPGFTFIIRSVLCGRCLSLFEGRIELAPQDTRSSVLWECMERDGWLGFKNSVSGKYIGYHQNGMLHGSAEKHGRNECFAYRLIPGRAGSILLMTSWESLWAVGSRRRTEWRVWQRSTKGHLAVSFGNLLGFDSRIQDRTTHF
jgi:hypothetical protein